MFKAVIFKSLFSAAAVAALVQTALPACAQQQITGGREPDWLVQLDVSSQEPFYRVPGSRLSQIVKVHVSFRPGGSGHGKRTFDYEDLWYRQCEPVGLKRYGKPSIRAGEDLVIKVKQSTTRPASTAGCACANAALRVFFDTYLAAAITKTIIVPDILFPEVIRYFQTKNFFARETTPDVPIEAVVSLRVQAETSGEARTLFYDE